MLTSHVTKSWKPEKKAEYAKRMQNRGATIQNMEAEVEPGLPWRQGGSSR